MIKNLRFRYIFSGLFFLLLTMGFRSVGQTDQANSFFGDFDSGFSVSHEEALSSANLEQYRLRNSRRIFEFESGVKFELLSAIEMTEAGYLVDPGNYITQSELNPMVRYIFRLGQNNQLAIRSEIDPNSKLAGTQVVPASTSRSEISASDLQQMTEGKRAFVLSNPDLFEIE